MHAGGPRPVPRLAAANHVPEFARVAADRAPGLVGSAMGPDGALRKKQHNGLITGLFCQSLLGDSVDNLNSGLDTRFHHSRFAAFPPHFLGSLLYNSAGTKSLIGA